MGGRADCGVVVWGVSSPGCDLVVKPTLVLLGLDG